MKASSNMAKGNNPDATDNLSREDFLALWTPLVEGDRAQTAAFDKVIITLSSAALALSITFIHDIAPIPKEQHWLAIAWIGFGTSLVVNLVSYLIGQRAYRRQVEILQDVADQKENARDQSNMFLTSAIWLNSISAIAFIVGV